jgi:hypothetical protein
MAKTKSDHSLFIKTDRLEDLRPDEILAEPLQWSITAFGHTHTRDRSGNKFDNY